MIYSSSGFINQPKNLWQDENALAYFWALMKKEKVPKSDEVDSENFNRDYYPEKFETLGNLGWLRSGPG